MLHSPDIAKHLRIHGALRMGIPAAVCRKPVAVPEQTISLVSCHRMTDSPPLPFACFSLGRSRCKGRMGPI